MTYKILRQNYHCFFPHMTFYKARLFYLLDYIALIKNLKCSDQEKKKKKIIEPQPKMIATSLALFELMSLQMIP